MQAAASAMKIFDQLERKRQWSEEEQAILDAVQRVADEVIAPSAAAYDKSGEFPVDERRGASTRSASTAIFVPEAYGGSPARYKVYLGGGEDHLGGVRLHRHHLRHQLPRHEAADRLRQRGAEAPPAAAHRRRRPRRARHHRARGRLRRHRHAHALHARRRPHRRRRRQDLHHQRRRRRPAAGVRQVERDRRRQGRDLGAGAGEGHAGLLGRAAPRTRWACAPPPRRRSTSTSAACRAPTCWARPATA